MLHVDREMQGQKEEIVFVTHGGWNFGFGPWTEDYIPADIEAAPLCRELAMIIIEINRISHGKLQIKSGYRLPAHNTEINGSEQSAHTMGFGVDVAVIGTDPNEVYVWAVRRGVRGVILYPTFVHLDMFPRVYHNKV